VATLPADWIIASMSLSASTSMPISRLGWASASSLIEQRNARLTVFMVLNSVVNESTICAGGSATSESSSALPPSMTICWLRGFPSSFPTRWAISLGVNSLPVGSLALRNSVSPRVISNRVRTGITTNACSSSTACCKASREVKNGITEVPSSFSQC